VPGQYVDVHTGQVLGSCPNMLAVTHGQRPGLPGGSDRTFVAGKDVPARLVYVASGGEAQHHCQGESGHARAARNAGGNAGGVRCW
jgi:hypothetical protein